MPARSCSVRISRSRSADIRWKSAIMPSIWATLRRFSSTWNFFRRISVSRDFIDSYSPEVPERGTEPVPVGDPTGFSLLCDADHGVTKLAFRFQAAQDLFELTISVVQTGDFLLGLFQKPLQRPVQPDGLVD